MDNNSKYSLSLTPCGVLFIVFLVLKLTHVIDWSWWWITAPLWIPIAWSVCVLLVLAIATGLIILFDGK